MTTLLIESLGDPCDRGKAGFTVSQLEKACLNNKDIDSGSMEAEVKRCFLGKDTRILAQQFFLDLNPKMLGNSRN